MHVYNYLANTLPVAAFGCWEICRFRDGHIQSRIQEGQGLILMIWVPFYLFGLTLIPAWYKYISSKVWVEITFPFPNFNGCTIEVWEWISNFIPHFIMDVITDPCWN